MQFYDYNPTEDGTINVTIPIVDMGNGEGFLSVQFTEEEIAFTVSEMDDGEELYSVRFTHEDFCDFLEARDFAHDFIVMLTKQRAEEEQEKQLGKTKKRHPASRNHLQIIDGGGNE